MKVWDAIRHRDTIPIPAAPKTRHVMTFSPDGQIAQTGLHESTIHLWNTTTGEPRGKPLKLEHKAGGWYTTADGKRVVLTDEGRDVTIWDVAASEVVHTFKHNGPARSVGTALSPDGKWFACIGPGGGLKVWDVENGVEFRAFKVVNALSWFVFSAVGFLNGPPCVRQFVSCACWETRSPDVLRGRSDRRMALA